jgi:hypothetical protein
MRSWILVALLTAPAAALRAEGVEDRLLEGEILEVSKGDLEKAMAIYRAIHADEKAPEAARARALLYLARCQRKVGEIEAARKTLDDLVKAHAKEEEVIRQARSFLREIESGKAESPRFDWLREMEKSPEVQAKAFDLAMDLALNPNEGEYLRAMRQLRALGTLAAPILERVIETSRDPTQRVSIAVLLAQMGRYERLPVIFETDVSVRSNYLVSAFQTVVAVIPDLEERARKEFLAAVERAPETTKRDLVRQICLLAGAKEGEVDPLLRGLEGGVERWDALAIGRALTRTAARDPAAARAIAGRIVDRACPAKAREIYFSVLGEASPASLGTDEYVAHIEALETNQAQALEQLPDAGKFEVLLRLTAGPARDAVTALFWSSGVQVGRGRAARGSSRVPSQSPSPDPRWAPVLRAAKDWRGLHILAELNEAAIPDLVEFLRNRSTLAPEYGGCVNANDCAHAAAWGQPGGGPSAALLEAMAKLIDAEDPITVAIAIETLSLGSPEAVSPAFTAVERLARSAADDRVRELALHVLVKVFGMDPEKGSAVARTLFDEFRRRVALGETPETYARSPLFEVQVVGFTRIGSPSTSSRRFADTLDWVFAFIDNPPREALYPDVLKLANADGGAPFERSFAGRWRANDHVMRTRYLTVAAPHLEPVTSPELMASVAEKLIDGLRASGVSPREGLEAAVGSPAAAAQIAAFFRRVVAEPAVPLKLRLTMFEWGGQAAFEWFEWETFLGKDDPLADEIDHILFNKSSWFQALPESERSAIAAAALGSPRATVRIGAVGQVSLERKDAAEVLKGAIDDSHRGVRAEALKRLAGITRTDVAPVFHDLLASPHADVRAGVVEALIRFADPRSIEPIVKLLDDPDIDVRAKALEAVKAIRKTLEERDEWKAWARGAAKPAKESPKD